MEGIFRDNLASYIKNAIGWGTKRKFVVIEVDDYGNVRVASKHALQNMLNGGLKIINRYDYYDSLETTEDLEMLYEALNSVRDKYGNPAVITALAVAANINFERMEENYYENYFYEPLPETFSKLKGYESTWNLWQEGIRKKLIVPEFHGREHLNIKLLMENLRKNDKLTMLSLQNRSYTGIHSFYKTISFSAAFDFEHPKEIIGLKVIMDDGLKLFKDVFGYSATHFNSPGGRESTQLHDVLAKNNVRSFIMPIIHYEHQGHGEFSKNYYYTGKRNKMDQIAIVRNAVFEPGDYGEDKAIAKCMRQIATAFSMGKPAIVSSHRVNFCGNIDPLNRLTGINSLKKLLKNIVMKWPDVEFITTSELTKEILKS